MGGAVGRELSACQLRDARDGGCQQAMMDWPTVEYASPLLRRR
jgi:hypothetical protein